MKYIGSFDNSLLREVAEFEKRYTNTWLYIEQPGKIADFFMFKKAGEGKYKFWNPEYGYITLNEETEVTVSCVYPPLGFFNTGSGFAHFQRYPERQWKRAPCQNNCVVRQRHLTMRASNNIAVDYTKLQDALKGNFGPKNLTQCIDNILAMTKVVDKVDGCALNRQWAVSISPTSLGYNDFLLWYMNLPVATMSIGVIDTRLYNPMVKQEIMDLLRDTNDINWEVL